MVRWRVFLQSFVMFVRHIAGTKNTAADWLSRMHAYVSSERIDKLPEEHGDASCLLSCMLEYPGLQAPAVHFAEELTTVCAAERAAEAVETAPEQKVWTHSEMFSEVHGGRKLHWGARRTWQALNKRFPGHGISFRAIEDIVSSCPICQKDRVVLYGYVEPVYRHLKKGHSRGAVGVDLLTVTPGRGR